HVTRVSASGSLPIDGGLAGHERHIGARLAWQTATTGFQFTKAPNVLRGMGLMHLVNNEKAKKELADKGMALD
ncbi:MAG: hypothetical protein WBX37_08585, partial [Pseudolabrys sp.]